MWENYEKEQEQIRAPEYLKTKTLAKMNASKVEKRFSLLGPRSILLVACSFLAIFLWTNGGLFENSDVFFERITSNPRHFLPAGEAVTVEQFELEVDSRLSHLAFTDLFLDMERSSWFWDEAVPLEARGIYVFSNGDRRIEIALTYRDAPLETNSIVGERAIALYYHESLLEVTYMALFMEGDHLYHVRGMGLTEEQFVAYVEKILRFLE